MAFRFLCEQNSLAVGEKKAFNVDGEKVLLIHLEDGFYATGAKCPHMSMPLEKGKLIDGQRIQCKFHHAEFDIKTGKACQWACFPPGIQLLNVIRGQKDLPTYALKIDDGRIYVEL
ncbi:MAG: Rieske 2Fe-2S domain-containing protein [Gammaproteobacteria bacterium]|nr:Rieske 2Fe-2S domain-containing protein [Gammaproteobacteria bacterium]